MFRVGQKVKIIRNTCGHKFKIGSIVTIESLSYNPDDNSWDLYYQGWVFDQDDCEPI